MKTAAMLVDLDLIDLSNFNKLYERLTVFANVQTVYFYSYRKRRDKKFKDIIEKFDINVRNNRIRKIVKDIFIAFDVAKLCLRGNFDAFCLCLKPDIMQHSTSFLKEEGKFIVGCQKGILGTDICYDDLIDNKNSTKDLGSELNKSEELERHSILAKKSLLEGMELIENDNFERLLTRYKLI